jgi:hypothetical protein
MINARPTSELPTAAELVRGVLLVPIGVVLSVTVYPGFLLCVPGFCLLALMVAVPLVALALVVVAAGVVLAVTAVIVALPRLLVQAIRARREGAPAIHAGQPVLPAGFVGKVPRSRRAVASLSPRGSAKSSFGLKPTPPDHGSTVSPMAATRSSRPRKALT